MSSLRLGTLFAGCAAALMVAAISPMAQAAPPPKTEPVHNRGRVALTTPLSNQIIELQTRWVVPATPPKTGTTFLWPGLEPSANGTNWQPIGTGVLQPVLTWGPSCAPAAGKPADPYASWWISAQYVNTLGSDPDYQGCKSGPAMLVQPGDTLKIDMKLDPATGIWVQTIFDRGQSVSYEIDLKYQAQNRVFFLIENYDGAPYYGPLVFSDTTITFAHSDQSTCASWASVPGVAGVHAAHHGTECLLKTVTIGL
jgi:hypothetical protein